MGDFIYRVSFPLWGRVWVHHLSLSSGHCRNSDGWWLSCPILWSIKNSKLSLPRIHHDPLNSFAFIYICQQIEKTVLATAGTLMGGGGHYPLLFWQWPELKLSWWTQTLPRLYRIHYLPGRSVGRACTSDCLENSFIMVCLWEKNFLSKARTKKILSACSSYTVQEHLLHMAFNLAWNYVHQFKMFCLSKDIIYYLKHSSWPNNYPCYPWN